MDQLGKLVADLISEVGNTPVISRRVTGKLWFIFTQMLSEADHTRAPEEILRRAWNYAEQLEKLFGPSHGQGPPTPGAARPLDVPPPSARCPPTSRLGVRRPERKIKGPPVIVPDVLRAK